MPEKKKKGIVKTITTNATFAAIVGALIGSLGGYFLAKDVQEVQVVPYNEITSHIKNELVDSGYVSEEVLEKENPYQQIEFIGHEFSKHLNEERSKTEKLVESVRSILVNCGESESLVNEMDFDTLDDELNQHLSKMESNDNITLYIKSELVGPGYVSEEALAKDNPSQQIKFIGQYIGGKLKEANETSSKMIENVQTFLIDCGENENVVRNMSVDELASALTIKSSAYINLESDLDKAKIKLSEYDKLPVAELSTPNVIISGEQVSGSPQGFQAIIGGQNYYSEKFLNSFLEYDLLFEDGTLYYHKESPERVKVSEDMVYDKSYSATVRLDGSYTTYKMGTVEYNNGIVFTKTDSIGRAESLKIASKKMYSSIEFKVGHIDTYTTKPRNIYIYYQDDEGEFILSETIQCTSDMPVKTYTVPIYNTNAIRISSSSGGGYLLTDLYLVK